MKPEILATLGVRLIGLAAVMWGIASLLGCLTVPGILPVNDFTHISGGPDPYFDDTYVMIARHQIAGGALVPIVLGAGLILGSRAVGRLLGKGLE
jgi:hypothetical protein